MLKRLFTNASLSTAIGFLALISSLTTIYIQFFYTRDKLDFINVSQNILGDSAGVTRCMFTVSFINNGNRAVTMLELSFVPEKLYNNLPSNVIEQIDGVKSPFIIEPEKTVTLKYKLSIPSYKLNISDDSLCCSFNNIPYDQVGMRADGKVLFSDFKPVSFYITPLDFIIRKSKITEVQLNEIPIIKPKRYFFN